MYVCSLILIIKAGELFLLQPSAPDESGQEREVLAYGGGYSVVAAHDDKSLTQRCKAVGCGETFHEIVYNGVGDVDVEPRMLKATDAPLIVGGVAVGGVEWCGYAGVDDKSLMTHDHAVGKAAEGEMVGCCEMAVGYSAAERVDNLGLSVDDARMSVGPDSLGYETEGVGRMEGVAGVEKDEIFAPGTLNSLVHGVIETRIGLGPDADVLRVVHFLSQKGSAVGRIAVHDYMLIVAEGLPGHAGKGDRKHTRCIPCDRDYGKKGSMGGCHRKIRCGYQ